MSLRLQSIVSFILLTLLFTGCESTQPTPSTAVQTIPANTLGSALTPAPGTILVLDDDANRVPPKHFRSAETIRTALKKKKTSSKGLEKLHASGSATFTKDGIHWMRKHLQGDLIIVDLRQESHALLNNNPCTWLAPHDWGNLDKTREQIIQEEASLATQLLQDQVVRPFDATALKKNPKARPTIVRVLRTCTEQALVEKQGLTYFRLTVPDHMRPTDDDVDRFIAFHRGLGKNAWLHFHCRGGDGRTTTFLAMDDMLHNADKVSFDDIISRQAAVAPYDHLLQTRSKSIPAEIYRERTAFLRNFYRFAQVHLKGHVTGWSEWLESQRTR